MPADKKSERENMQRPEKEVKKNNRHEDKQSTTRSENKQKSKRVTYVVKDLPIY